MKAIYSCQHCGGRVEVTIEGASSARETYLNMAYMHSVEAAQAGMPPYAPHTCDPSTTGVAQLVAMQD